MSIPNSRTTLIDYCLRQLGWPVIKVNLDDDQIDDRVDEAMQYFQDYHYDASEKIFMKHKLTAADIANKYIDLTQASGTVVTTNGSTEVVGTATEFASEFMAGVTVIGVNGENKTVTAIANNTHLTVDSAFSTTNIDAPIRNISGPDSILGVTRIFPIGSSAGRINMFDYRYQMRLNDLWTFTSASYVTYAVTMSHLRTMEMLFQGETSIRFNRHQTRLYIDMQWGTSIQPGEFLVIEGYKLIDPESYTRVYNDRWLKRYLTALLKKQWGTNLKKFMGVQLPGGIVLNGQGIYDEAVAEIATIEAEMSSKYELPVDFLIG